MTISRKPKRIPDYEAIYKTECFPHLRNYVHIFTAKTIAPGHISLRPPHLTSPASQILYYVLSNYSTNIRLRSWWLHQQPQRWPPKFVGVYYSTNEAFQTGGYLPLTYTSIKNSTPTAEGNQIMSKINKNQPYLSR